jgi:hypothetical protein
MFGGKGSSPVLLKVMIIMVSPVDTRATITSVRTKLSNLDHVVCEEDSNIEHFNDYVIGLVSKLHARGKQTQNILVNFFKVARLARMLKLWNTSRMMKAFRLTTNNKSIGLSTSSKPGKSQSSGVREVQKRKPSFSYKPMPMP